MKVLAIKIWKGKKKGEKQKWIINTADKAFLMVHFLQ